MQQLFFCNIGWMSRYEGLAGKPDKIVGGGRHVDENEHGHEVCNFVSAKDGFVYGHVETIKDGNDRNLQLVRLGGQGESVSKIDVVWTATHPDEGGRRVIGWYRNATVFRERQYFGKAPSQQHKKDEVNNYRIRARAEDAQRLEIEGRTLFMPHGKGWMGHTPWWYLPQKPNVQVKTFIKQVRTLMDSVGSAGPKTRKGRQGSEKSPSSANDPYVRYVEGYEIEIHPNHSDLQNKFVGYLSSGKFSDVRENISCVDLRFQDKQKGLVLAEIKPCNKKNARFAIRTAIGQLLDYRQRENEKARMLIVLEVSPKPEDLNLAVLNGFGVAYPTKGRFEIIWPND